MSDLFDINLLKKNLKRAKKYLEFDQLLYRLASETSHEIISSYNKTFTKAIDLSFFPQKIITSADNIKHLTVLPGIFDSKFLKEKEEKYDLIISNLSIQSINNITDYIEAIYNLLNDGGIFIGSIFGSQTLQELKHIMMLTESSLSIAHTPNIIPLLDIQKVGNLLQKVHFKMPVVDSNIYIFEYKNAYDLCVELKKLGLTNHMYKRRKDFLGNQYLQILNEIYKSHYPSPSGLQSSFEILSFIAVK
jgi:SAM-dependent methyltransferase